MKAITTNFFLISALLFLVSCSAGKKAVTLEVSSAAISAAGFTGGLIVSGVTADGTDSFISTASTGQDVTVKIKNGKWIISATGWDGATAFAGSAHCGQTIVDLDSYATAISLTANSANCNTPEFRGNYSSMIENGAFLPLRIFSCGALYELSGSEYLPISDTTSPTTLLAFCSEMPGRLNSTAKSAKIYVKGDGETTPKVSSSCLPAAGNYIASTIQFPAVTTPATLELFDKAHCSGDSVVYDFKKGIMAGDSTIDSILSTDFTNDTVNLILPFNELKKGFSPLMNLMPTMKCNNADCLSDPGFVTPTDYFIFANTGFRDIKLDIPSCANRTFTGTNLTFPASNICEEKEDGVFVYVQTSPACESVACTLTITDTSTGAAVNTTKTISSNLTVGWEKQVYDQVWRLFGTSSTNLFFDASKYRDDNGGLISRAQEEMGPGGPVSLFGNIACADMNGIKDIELLEEGALRKYRVEAKPSTAAIPLLLCDSANPNTISCPVGFTNFHKQIALKEYVNSAWITRDVLHVRCDVKIGFSESQQEKLDGSEIRTEKRIIGWNTQTIGTERAENLNYEIKRVGTTVTQARTSFERAEVLAGEYRGVSYNWNAHLNVGNYSEQLNQHDFFSKPVSINTYVTDYSKSFMFTSAAPGSIFDQPYFSQDMNHPYYSHDSFLARSPNGSKIVRTWLQYQGSNYKVYMSYYDAVTGLWTHPIDLATNSISVSSTATHTSPRAVVNDAGIVMIAWKQYEAGDYTIMMSKGTPGTMSNPIPLSVAQDTIGSLDVCMNGNKAAVVWDQAYSSTNLVRAAHITDINSGTWTLPTDSATHFISDASVTNSIEAKCAMNSNGNLIVSYIDVLNWRIKFTHGTLPALIADTAGNQTEDATIAQAHEVYLEIAANGYVYATIVDRTANPNATHVRKTSATAPATWVNPAVAPATTIPFIGYIDQAFMKNETSTIGTAPLAVTATPFTLGIPSYHSIVKGNQFGLKELKPDSVLGKFTPYATFINQ